MQKTAGVDRECRRSRVDCQYQHRVTAQNLPAIYSRLVLPVGTFYSGMQRLRRWLAITGGLGLVLLLGAQASGALKTEVRLVLDSDTALPGETLMAGLQMK